MWGQGFDNVFEGIKCHVRLKVEEQYGYSGIREKLRPDVVVAQVPVNRMIMAKSRVVDPERVFDAVKGRRPPVPNTVPLAGSAVGDPRTLAHSPSLYE